MKIGFIDVDGHNFPNLPLMKLSAWHKQQGDSVEWYEPLLSGHMDRVYLSKVFTFTKDYEYHIDTDEIIKGGTGYYPDGGKQLPYEIEHSYPDYSLYLEQTKDTAYGFLTRGCPRQCKFCIVSEKEGCKSRKGADLSEFWRGQKNIILLDPNVLACKDYEELLQQLIDSNSYVDFTQGLDIRLMTEKKIEWIKQIKLKQVRFAWDNYSDQDKIVPKLKEFKERTGWGSRKLCVYVLCGFDSILEEDLERIYTLRELGYEPYVMIYNKDQLPKKHPLRRLQRWVNNRMIFKTTPKFEDYKN